jgi:hypothetical protein
MPTQDFGGLCLKLSAFRGVHAVGCWHGSKVACAERRCLRFAWRLWL